MDLVAIVILIEALAIKIAMTLLSLSSKHRPLQALYNIVTFQVQLDTTVKLYS